MEFENLFGGTTTVTQMVNEAQVDAVPQPTAQTTALARHGTGQAELDVTDPGSNDQPDEQFTVDPTDPGGGLVAPPTGPLPPATQEPPATDDAEQASTASGMAGVKLLLAAAGAGAGGLTLGIEGAGAGLLLAGGAANAITSVRRWNSQNEVERRDARISAVLAVVGVGVGGYLGYRALAKRQE